ncbi:MAG TPA: alpha,alpha-trehalase TreA [Trinickia sp.]|uniref:alpha,alpha-trehalase TreA n=1 Tax=Trinickia sp. TaxID=2571163 RepID=UPI002B631820|nr:alpha,alpha-trehalase TreA [Trinickia sp.]HVW50063.1 alpha,alpha-trehalase TreA [Trinickia sp.]
MFESSLARGQGALRARTTRLAGIVLLAGLTAASVCRADAIASLPPPPSELYGDLFVAVQTQQIFPDQKTFVDAVPNGDPASIMQIYEQQKAQPNFDLKRFVLANFTLPSEPVITPPSGQTLREHIDWLWPKLTRTTTAADVPANSSLIPLPKPYVVPGGRFREGYYWDTYFTMLGLQESGHEDLVDDMLDDFAYEIDRFGHIPNGNRTYYLSRSQPPFFALMVQLAAKAEGPRVYQKYLPALKKEYAYWMTGAATTARGHATRNVVVLNDGTVLNRYWDARDTPRDESYLEDVTTAKQAVGRNPNEVYRDLRAAAESGWDFSSRWFGDNKTLTSIRTTSIIPVDLNSLLFALEATIAKGCALSLDFRCTADYVRKAERRAEGINRYLWHPKGYYADYDWRLGKLRDNLSAAAVYPLFVRAAWPERAAHTIHAVSDQLLKTRGLATTTFQTGQQWDAPNGWAPLHWLTVKGVQHYLPGAPLAKDVGTRFLTDVKQVYASDQKLVEKYVVEGPNAGGGGGGEYPLQDGFGWTNGVTLKLLDMYAPGE